MKKKDKQQSRRNFINKTAISTASIAVASGIISTLTQCQNKESSEKVKLLSTEGTIVEVDKDKIDKIIPEIDISSTHHVREGIPGRKWVMVIDLSKCKGAGKCMSACSKMHYLPPHKSYIQVPKMKNSDLLSPHWMPLLCFHCDKPPCVKVCPVGATFKLSDGIVGIDNERCIGCRFCMVACPYSARIFNWSKDEYKLTEEQLSEITPHEVCQTHIKGTVEKCDFCPHNLVKGILPDCVTSCPFGAFYFGDENENAVSNGIETVILTELLKDKSGYTYLKDLGTKPRVYYLPPVDREIPFKDIELDKSKYI